MEGKAVTKKTKAEEDADKYPNEWLTGIDCTNVTIISRHANYGNAPIAMEQRDHVETIGVSLTVRSHS
jgi:hypothetical protein